MSYVDNMTDLGDKVMGRVSSAIDQEDFSGLADGIREDFRVFADDLKAQGFNFGKTPAGPRYDINDLDHSNNSPKVDFGCGSHAQAQSRPKPHAQSQPHVQSQAQSRPQGQQAGAAFNNARPQGQQAGAAFNNARPQGQQVKPQYQSKARPRYGRPYAGPVPFMLRTPGKGNNIGLCGVGIVGMLMMLASLTEEGVISMDNLAGLGVRAAFLLGFLILFGIGFVGKGITDTFYKYASIIGREEYIDIKDLAKHAGESEKTVRKNLGRMIKRRMLPHAAFDDSGKTLILSSKAYKQYTQAKEASESAKRKQAEVGKNLESMDPALAAQVRGILSEGDVFLGDLANAQARVKDPEMKRRLTELEQVVSRIFDRVQEAPGSARTLRRFMNQYLPTTRKLINAYIDIENQPVEGENIRDTKQEIEGAMDTINNAYVVLLDSLYQDVAWDVSADISAMKTMFQQDGLMEDGMHKANPFEGIVSNEEVNNGK